MTKKTLIIFILAFGFFSYLSLLADERDVFPITDVKKKKEPPTDSELEHDLLSLIHTDVNEQGVSRGSLIYGNSTPKWDELTIGSNQKVFVSDGTDPSWGTVDISGGTNLSVTSPVTLTVDDIGWASTLIDATTWSDGANASNAWTFDVSGTDTTMTAGNGTVDFSHNVSGATVNDLYLWTAATDNFALGDSTTLSSLTGGDDNVAIGSGAGENLLGTAGTQGDGNTLVGTWAGNGITEGRFNTCIGSFAGWSITTGERGFYLGEATGGDITTGCYNVFVGNGVGDGYTTVCNRFIIDAFGRGNDLEHSRRSLLYGTFHSPGFVGPPVVPASDPTLAVNGDFRVGHEDYPYSSRFGDGGTTNYTEIADDGTLAFNGTARIDWAKITADNITQGNGTHSGTTGDTSGLVGDLAVAHDGNFYHIDEVGADPGFELMAEFISVTAFNWVNIYVSYDGANTHSVQIALWNFNTTTWNGFDSIPTTQAEVATAGEYTLGNHDFFVPSDTNYIGTGGDAGDVRVRIRHTTMGNANHDLDIDVIALYQ